MAVFYKYEYMGITKNIHPWSRTITAEIGRGSREGLLMVQMVSGRQHQYNQPRKGQTFLLFIRKWPLQDCDLCPSILLHQLLPQLLVPTHPEQFPNYRWLLTGMPKDQTSY